MGHVTSCTESSILKQGAMLITQAGERQYLILSVTNSGTIVEILYAASWLPLYQAIQKSFSFMHDHDDECPRNSGSRIDLSRFKFVAW